MSILYSKRNALRLCALTLAALMLLVGCAQNPVISSGVSDTLGTEAVTDAQNGNETPGETPPPDSKYSTDAYNIISKSEYVDKTTSGFLAMLAGFLSGHEFAQSSEGKCAIGMPDSKFEYLGGLYATNSSCDKHIKHVTSGLWEVWFDDDFSVDIVNQYILADMYRQKYTTCQKLITDGWINYDVWDMGGGQRKAGAYGVISRRNYLPQFAGNTEYDNWYSYLSESYIATDSLGMNAPGMPETARELAEMFSQVTGDRDNMLWAQMFAVMISRAYFESDIEALIRTSAESVFPEGSWPREVMIDVFEVYEKYPDDWREAYKDYESRHYLKGDTTQSDTDINCGFVILDLLYGKGDYMETCKIGSLAGYDCETTCGIALTILGIMGGTDILPEETNEKIWQDGRGILVNLVCPGDRDDEGVWMIADGLAERMEIIKVIEKYQKNFESVLAEQGGAMDEYYYYIPKQQLDGYDAVVIENGDFETGDLSGYTVTGDVSAITVAVTGRYAAKLENNGSLTTKVSGLKVGESYAFTAFVRTSDASSAFLFARENGGANAVTASVRATKGTPKYEAQSNVKRTLVFTATAAEMELGVIFVGTGAEFAVADSLTLIRLNETSAGVAEIKEPADNNTYQGSIAIKLNVNTAGEHYLKVRFANANTSIVDLPLTVNYKKYASAALYKTDAIDGAEAVDCLYIPIVLEEGENIISSSFKSSVQIYSAEIVDITARIEQ